jgi:hypothetical protein
MLPSQFSSRFRPHIFDIGPSHEIHITGYSFLWSSQSGSVTIKFYAAQQLKKWELLDTQTVAVRSRSVSTFSMPRNRSLYSRIALIVSAPFSVFGTLVELPLPELPADPMERLTPLTLLRMQLILHTLMLRSAANDKGWKYEWRPGDFSIPRIGRLPN